MATAAWIPYARPMVGSRVRKKGVLKLVAWRKALRKDMLTANALDEIVATGQVLMSRTEDSAVCWLIERNLLSVTVAQLFPYANGERVIDSYSF